MAREARVQILYRHHCGWERYVTSTAEWQWTPIEHPLYGTVTNQEAAELDISYHYCTDYLRARRRSPRSRADLKVNYDNAKDVA